jgi:hypothetical protein
MPRIFLLVPALLCASVLAFGAEPAAEPEAGAPGKAEASKAATPRPPAG